MSSSRVEIKMDELRRRLTDIVTIAQLDAASCQALAHSSWRRVCLTRRAVEEAREAAAQVDLALANRLGQDPQSHA